MTDAGRLLYLAPDPALRLDQQGGAGTHMRGTVDALRSAGFEVAVSVGSPASPEWHPTSIQRPVSRRVRVRSERIRLLARDLRLLAHGRAFRRALSADVDCVYERSAYLLDVGRPFARRVGVPYVVETDGILVEARAAAYGAVLRGFAERLEQRKIRSADAVVVMSEASREHIGTQYGVSPDRIVVKGLGVESSLLERPVSQSPITYDVGYAGTFQPYHGLDLLLDALGDAPGRRALLVGDGPLRPEIERRIAAGGIAAELTGSLPRSEALRQLEQCRVLVIPESAETIYPVKLLEYAALGRPVVCPRRPAFAEFQDGDEPLLFTFEPRDAHDLSRALGAAADESASRRVAALRELVASAYTWEATGRRLAAAFDRLGLVTTARRSPR